MSRVPVKLFILLVCLTAIFYLGDRTGLLKPVRGGVEYIVRPVSFVFYQGMNRLDSLLYPLVHPWVRDQELRLLREKVRSLATTSAALSFLEKENDALKKQLGVKDHINYSLILAHPIGYERYLVLDRGEHDGIALGETVVSSDILIGKIVKLTPKMAWVQLVSDPQSSIPVWTRQLTRGVAKGEFGKAMVLDRVLQNDPLTVGEILSTTGEEGYEQNIVVGTIGSIKSEPRDVFKSATIDRLIDLGKLTTVFTIKKI